MSNEGGPVNSKVGRRVSEVGASRQHEKISGFAINASREVRVGIMGTPTTSGNRGVLALAAALVGLCMEAAPRAKIALFGSNRDARPIAMRPFGIPVELPIFHWRLSPKSAFRDHLCVIVAFSFLYRMFPAPAVRRWIRGRIPWIKALEETSIVGDVRGGDSFSDIYGLQRFITATLPVLSVLAVKGEIILFPQTFGPFKSPFARSIAKFILLHAGIIIARDKESQRIAQELVGTERKVLLSPDVAFALHPNCPPHIVVEPQLGAPLSQPLVGLNVNGLMFNGGYTSRNMFGLKLDYPQFVVELIKEILAVHPGELLMVPHTFEPATSPESDNDASQRVREMLPHELRGRVKIVKREYDPHELKGIIGKCDFFIGSRMHSCIAALSQGVPCAAVAYSMKFAGVFDSVGMVDHVIDARLCSKDDAVRMILDLYLQRDGRRTELKIRAEEARDRLRGLFRVLIGSAESAAEGDLNTTNEMRSVA